MALGRETHHPPSRQAAKRIGIQYTTYFRLEEGRDPSGTTLAKILTWLLAKERR